MTDHSYAREALERWKQGDINIFDAMADVLLTKIEQFRTATTELIRLLEIEEESDDGNRFHPNRISSCRVIDGMQINQCLKKLKELAAE
jgi:hypothetical protein